MRFLRWLAIVPFVIGLWALLASALWTEFSILLVAAPWLAGAAIIWRAFAGAWPPRVAS